MKRTFMLIVALLSVTTLLKAQHQPPPIEWQILIGGSLKDDGRMVHQTTDGGYILTATTFSNNRDVSGNHGSGDVWVVKLTATGNIVWQKCLGGTAYDEAWSILQVNDGGYILAGMAKSINGNVTSSHGNDEFWIVKLDASGNITWQKTYGGSSYETATSIVQTADGGYIATGYTSSNNYDVSGNHGDWDYWIIKLDAVGNLQWQKTYGGNGTDEGFEILQATDGGYVVTGREQSTNSGNVTGAHGYYDAWIIKLDAAGNLQWQKTLGGSAYDVAFSIEKTNDGGYIVAGSTVSNDGDVQGNHGAEDAWIVKLDASGNIQWQKTYGGTDVDLLGCIRKTADGGYIAAGYTASHDGDVTGVAGGWDMWVVKLDVSGNMQWQKALGASGDEAAWTVQQTADGGYIISGGNDIAAANAGDVFVVKLRADGGTTLASTWYDFTAKHTGKNAELNWQIVSDRPGGYFEVQRSTNGIEFSTVAIVMEAEPDFIRSGYKYLDRNVGDLSQPILYYRLQYIDGDGAGSLSSIAALRFNIKSNSRVAKLWPTTGQGSFHIWLPDAPANRIRLAIYTASGQVVKQEFFQSQKYSFDLGGQSKGVYFFHLSDDAGLNQSGRIVLE